MFKLKWAYSPSSNLIHFLLDNAMTFCDVALHCDDGIFYLHRSVSHHVINAPTHH